MLTVWLQNMKKKHVKAILFIFTLNINIGIGLYNQISIWFYKLIMIYGSYL